MSGIQVADGFRLITTEVASEQAAFARDVKAGLTAFPKYLSCRYFYDAKGSALFEAICELPEYYLTRSERAILERYAREMVAEMPEESALVEFGSGSAVKTRLLIEALLKQQGSLLFVPVDISKPALEDSSRGLLADYQDLEVLGVWAEYQEGLERVREIVSGPKLILWLGSSVGNFDREEAAQFLKQVREGMDGEDRFLMGVDLRKDRGVLEAAYDDAQGVTAEFNLNLLDRINRELGGWFELERFKHRAVYDEVEGRMEMYLVSTSDQTVRIDGLDLDVPFDTGEAIFTEPSYKYSVEEIETLVHRAGFEQVRQWLDEDRRFSLNLLKVL
ncbi:MAG: L-histidine N(alpha)-methyltransferase [bacterium]|nr:L-histidine N(alpha)-methyltransferase [bacterium]